MVQSLNNPDPLISWLISQSNSKRIKEQRKARNLLLGEDLQNIDTKSPHADTIKQLKSELSSATEIFSPDAVQTNIYSADTGTHIIPDLFKKR